MEITEVRIKLMEDAGERLHAFCSITFDDCFVIRDLKIIEGTNGPFVAMPSRKLTSHCPQCGYKNHLRAGYCNQCGTRLKEDRAIKDEDGRAKLYADIAHPINSRCREMIQDKVIQSYHEELRAAKLPGYVSRYDDYEEEYVRPPHHTPAGGNSRGDRAPQRRDVASDGRPRDAAVDGRPRDAKGADQTKVEPAATEPRAPHKAPAPQRAPQPSERPRSAGGGFGDGIF